MWLRYKALLAEEDAGDCFSDLRLGRPALLEVLSALEIVAGTSIRHVLRSTQCIFLKRSPLGCRQVKPTVVLPFEYEANVEHMTGSGSVIGEALDARFDGR